ncbi:transmembrane 9 superfamily member 2-like [Humulus lupulus]|uniref:transmembrane 9 superfamily member 2-like n=1 Tax=Humulus lupulus TaxID=3486 RepID=UPI002B40AEC6|nr:transmembrane 9 superfamily member 2-like [Humulus lupulus]
MTTLVLMAMLLPLVISSGISLILDPVPNEKLYKGDMIHIFANRVRSRENYWYKSIITLLFKFFDSKSQTNKKSSFEELLAGDCFTLTRYELKFRKNIERKTLCEKTLTEDEARKFRGAIERSYIYEMSYNKSIFWSMVGRIVDVENERKLTIPKHYLVTHIHFYVKYWKSQVKDISILSNYSSSVDIAEVAANKVKFTYSVLWAEEPDKPGHFSGYTPFDEELMRLKEDGEIWNSKLFYWASATLVWVGLILTVTVPYLTDYLDRYDYLYCRFSSREQDHLDCRVNNQHLLHGDNCKCPPYTSLLGAVLGNGIQLLIMACIFFILAYKGFLNPCNLQSLSSLILRTYCITSFIMGYKATSFHAGFTSVGWKECIFQAGTLYYIPALSTVIIANGLVISEFGISEVPELGILCQNLVAWGLVSSILVILSGVVARRFQPESQPTCSTRNLPKETRQQPWYTNTAVQMLLGGLVPFILLLPKLDNIHASLWNFKICNTFQTLLTSFISIVIMNVILAIGFTVSQLSWHDHHWWWRSVLRGGTPAILMFFYGLYFFYRINIDESLLLRVLGYHFCISYALFLIRLIEKKAVTRRNAPDDAAPSAGVEGGENSCPSPQDFPQIKEDYDEKA